MKKNELAHILNLPIMTKNHLQAVLCFNNTSTCQNTGKCEN